MKQVQGGYKNGTSIKGTYFKYRIILRYRNSLKYHWSAYFSTLWAFCAVHFEHFHRAPMGPPIRAFYTVHFHSLKLSSFIPWTVQLLPVGPLLHLRTFHTRGPFNFCLFNRSLRAFWTVQFHLFIPSRFCNLTQFRFQSALSQTIHFQSYRPI